MKYLCLLLLLPLVGCAPLGGTDPSCDFDSGTPDEFGVVTCNMDYKTKIHPYTSKTIDFHCENGYVEHIKWTLSSTTFLLYPENSNEYAKDCAEADNQTTCALKVSNTGPTNHHVTTTLIACTATKAVPNLGGTDPTCTASSCPDMDYKTKLHQAQQKVINFACDPRYISNATYSTSSGAITPDDNTDLKKCMDSGYESVCSLAFTNSDPFESHHVTTKSITCWN